MRLPSAREIWVRGRQAILARMEAISSIQRLLSARDRAVEKPNEPSQQLTRLHLISPLDRPYLAQSIGCKDAAHFRSEKVLVDLALPWFENKPIDETIDWHFEPTSGARSPLLPWKKLDNLDSAITGDKKVIWELNRHQFLVRMARIYAATGDEFIAATICKHVRSWIDSNPVGRGVNWVSSLELAFRSISWIWAFAIIRFSDTWAKQDKAFLIASLGDHAGHIARHLSLYSSPNTHLTGEALALYVIGTVVPELESAERWRRLGRDLLLRELPKQVLRDGVYFERASWYQRYTLDFYVHFLLLAARSGDELPPTVHTAVESLAEHLMWITRPDGTSPYIGDDDGGKLLQMSTSRSDDWRSSLCTAAVVCSRGDFRAVAGEFAEETSWLLGESAEQEFENIRSVVPLKRSMAFFEGGYFVMRSAWHREANYLLFDCGPHGVMNCGHAHSDGLAIEVAALGETFLVDPGTYTYSANMPERDLFRHTKMHNTLTVDGLAASVSSGPFRWSHVAQQVLNCWHDSSGFTFVGGWHDGYRRLADPVTHERQVLFPMREYWIVLDRVRANARHTGELNFHLASSARISKALGSRGFSVVREKVTFDIVSCDDFGDWSQHESWLSPAYGLRCASTRVSRQFEFSGDTVILTFLLPRSSDGRAPLLTELNTKTGKCVRLDFGEFVDLMMNSANSCTEASVSETNCEWVWQRSTKGGAMFDRLFCVHGDTLIGTEFSLVSRQKFSFLEVAVQDERISIDIENSGPLKVRLPTGIVTLTLNGKQISVCGNKEYDLHPPQRATTAQDKVEECCSNVRN